MAVQYRRQQILDLLEQKKRVSVEQLAQQLQISKETVRRDLALLADLGKLRKVHGGAVLIQTSVEQSYSDRADQMRSEKILAAHKAAQLVNDGDSLFIDSGTTTESFAKLLLDKQQLTIVTNAISIATLLGRSSRVHLLGGAFNGETGANTGETCLQQIQQFHTDHAFLSIGGLNFKQGLVDYSEAEAAVARSMAQHAEQVTVIMDSSKFNRKALFKVMDLNAIDNLACDTIAAEFIPALDEQAVNIL